MHANVRLLLSLGALSLIICPLQASEPSPAGIIQVSLNGVVLTNRLTYTEFPDQDIDVSNGEFVVAVTSPGKLPVEHITVICEGGLTDETNVVAKGWSRVHSSNVFPLWPAPKRTRPGLVTEARYTSQDQFITSPVVIGTNAFNSILVGQRLGMVTHIRVHSNQNTNGYSVILSFPGKRTDATVAMDLKQPIAPHSPRIISNTLITRDSIR